MTKDLVLVSGATGYLGAHVVRDLLNNGFRVRGTVRDKNKTSGLEHLKKWIDAGEDLELVETDLLKSEGWEEACSGCRFVAHVASPFLNVRDDKDAEEKLFRPAKEGTLNVLKAAAKAGVERVVLTSSTVAVITGHDNPPFLEDPESQWSILEKSGNYEKSKHMAEKCAWDFVKSDEGKDLELVVINPGFITGPPISTGWATSHEYPKRLFNREMPGAPNLHYATVDVRDVAHSHTRGLQVKEAAGNRFVCAPESTSFVRWAKLLNEEFNPLGYKIPKRKIPYFLFWMLSFFDSDVSAIMPEIGKGPRNLSMKKIETVLGIKFRPIEKSIVEHAHACLQLPIKGYPAKTDLYKAKFPEE